MRKMLPAVAVSLTILVGSMPAISSAEAHGFGGGYGGGREGGFGAGGGYGRVPGRPNPYARDAAPWIGMDYNDLLQTPPNNSGSSLPNDCDYLFKQAVDSGTPEMWKLFNDCAHNR